MLNLKNHLKVAIKNLIPEPVLDFYRSMRLTPQKYRAHRIRKYEDTYDGAIIKLGNYKYRLHTHESVSRQLYADEVFSGDIINFFCNILPNFGSFLDIGANIGSISIPTMSKCPRPALSVEPVSRNFQLLQENLQLNQLSGHVKSLKAAIGDFDGRIQISLSPNNSGDHRINHTEHEDREYEEVPLYTLDKCLREYTDLTPPFLIKVDVQGYETHVIRGAKMLVDSPCAFVIELWPWGLDANGSSVADLEQAYKNLNLEAYVLRFKGNRVNLEHIMNLQTVANEIPSDWGSHLELLLTNRSLGEFGLRSFST